SAEVLVVRPGVGTLTPPPRHLQKGDQLSTGPTTRVLLRFANSAYVLVEPNTRLTISSLILEKGWIYVKTWWPSRRPISTRYFLLPEEGTRYSLSLDEQGHSVVQTQEGTVAVVSRSAAWPPVEVHRGEAVSINGAAAPEKYVLTSGDLAVLDTA